MSSPVEHPTDRWEPYETPSLVFAGGPVRVVTDEPDPDYKPRPVGFAPPTDRDDDDPLTWEGDGA